MSTLVRDVWVNGVASSVLVPSRFRWAFLRLAGLHVERRALMSEHVSVRGKGLQIGTYSFVGVNVVLDCSAPVRIGQGCSLGMGVTLVTGTHAVGPEHRRAGRNLASPVTLEDGCWLGANVTVLPGVTVGRGCIVGAGSLVTKDCLPNGVYYGRPARRVRDVSDVDSGAVAEIGS